MPVRFFFTADEHIKTVRTLHSVMEVPTYLKVLYLNMNTGMKSSTNTRHMTCCGILKIKDTVEYVGMTASKLLLDRQAIWLLPQVKSKILNTALRAS